MLVKVSGSPTKSAMDHQEKPSIDSSHITSPNQRRSLKDLGVYFLHKEMSKIDPPSDESRSVSPEVALRLGSELMHFSATTADKISKEETRAMTKNAASTTLDTRFTTKRKNILMPPKVASLPLDKISKNEAHFDTDMFS